MNMMEKVNTKFDDIELIDAVKAAFNFTKDVEIAAKIESTKAKLSNVRAGRKSLCVRERLNCYAKLDYAWAQEALDVLFD
jgi:hypothetical protein